MSDWQVGDLALCVTTKHPSFREASEVLRVGAVYTVVRVGRPTAYIKGEFALGLREAIPSRGPDYGFPQTMFRKIAPHTPDAEDAETIRLLNAQRVPVEA